MKGKAGRKKRVAAIAATILAFTGVATANPYLVYGQNNEKSITITGNTTEILKSSSDVQNQENHWSMKIDNETGKEVLFYDLKEGNKEITKKQAFKGDTLVLDLKDYDGNAVYTVDVYGVDKNVKASAKLYQVQANLKGDTSTSVPMVNGVVSESEKNNTYEAIASCVVNDIDYDLSGNANVTISYDSMKQSSGHSVDYTKHDASKNENVCQAGVQLTDDAGNVLSSENITYYGTYTYQAPKTFSQSSTDENGNNIVDYYKAIDGKAQAVLKKEDNGQTVKIAYQKVDSQTAYDWNINLIDLMTGTTLDTITKQVGVDQSQTYDAASTMEKDGVTYTLDASMQSSYTHMYGDKSRTTNIYYYNKAKWNPKNGYDITVKYVNIADRSQITSQTIAVTNAEDAVIDCPAEFQNGGHTYIRLKGQSDTIRHSYYSNIRQYTIYYRDSQDTINADTEINYVVVDGGEITVDDVIYRVVPGTTIAVAQNQGTTNAATGETTGASTTVLGDGNTEGTTSEVVQSADDQVPLADQKLDNKKTSKDEGTPLAQTLLGNKVVMAIAAAVILLLIIFGIFIVTKKRNEKGR